MWFIYPETANVRLEDMNSLFDDATTAAPTPQTLAEVESLFSGNRSPVPSFRLADDSNQDTQVPDLDIDPPALDVEDGKPIIKERPSEGLGGWISNIVKKGKGDEDGASGSGKYKRINDDDEQ